MTKIGKKLAEPELVIRPDYRKAPTLTLNELIPVQFKPERGQSTEKLHASFRTERIEFVLMCRKLVITNPEDLEWDLPDNELYDEIVTAASDAFFEEDITYSDALLWSSIGQTTGIGMFAMNTNRMDLIKKFRDLLRNADHETLEFETFPKESLLHTV